LPQVQEIALLYIHFSR